MTLNRRLRHTLCAAAALLALAAASAEAAPPVYRIIELEFPKDIGPYNSPQIFALNDLGESLGKSYSSDFTQTHVIIWKPDGSLTDVPGFPKKMGNLMLTGLNNLGQFTGNYDTQTYKPEHIIYTNAFVRDPAAGVQVFAQWEYLDPAPSNYFIPVDINDAGLVAGYGLNKDPAQVFETLFYTPATGIYAYPKRSKTASRPLSLNNAGQVLVNQHRHIFLASAPGHYAHVEPPRPNNRPNTQRPAALNNLGQVAGSYAGQFTVWRESAGTTLLPLPCTGSTAKAVDMNDSGEIVGQGCGADIYYSPVSGASFVADLIDPADPLLGKYLFFSARKINNRGEILAMGFRLNGLNRPLLLAPVR